MAGKNKPQQLPLTKGLDIQRIYTEKGQDPLKNVKFTTADASIYNADGSVNFKADNIEVPASWDKTAVDILASKYFRRAGVPQINADGSPKLTEDGKAVLGGETSARQWAHRMANAWMVWGEKGNYFASKESADAFYDEMVYILINQIASPNSPQHFNTGLFESYGITGDAEGNSYWDEEKQEIVYSKTKHERSAVNACYIMGVKDQLVGDGSIFDLLETEARLFKAGSGTGSNYSAIRGKGEKLSGGGTSSGLMSFLKVSDAGAGAIKSGGTTRRAAKMVIVDIDHPDVIDFIEGKAKEEKKVAALVAAGFDSSWTGEAYQSVAYQNFNGSVRLPNSFMDAVKKDGEWHLTARTDGMIVKTLQAQELWDKVAQAAWQSADPGVQFEDTINDWNTVANDGRLKGTNPCSEFVFLDNTACNLASIRLTKFYNPKTTTFDADAFKHVVRLFALMLEISVSMSHYPSEIVARNSFKYRPLGLGYADLGSLLMQAGLPYDSEEGRSVVGAVTALMHDTAYATSSEIAEAVGACEGYEANIAPMERVIKNHARAAYGDRLKESDLGGYETLGVEPVGVDHKTLNTTNFANLSDEVIQAAESMLAGMSKGFRNMQATVLAPTGCLTPDALIATDRGLVRLDELGDVTGAQWQDAEFKVATDEGVKDATKFYINGLSSVVKVKTVKGHEITGTPEHRIKIVDQNGEWQWKRFAELTAGDQVPMMLGGMVGQANKIALTERSSADWSEKMLFDTPATMDTELAGLIGFISSSDLEDVAAELKENDSFKETASRVFNVDCDAASIIAVLESKVLKEWWRGNGFDSEDIPEKIRKTNTPVIYQSYLNGILASRGVLNNKSIAAGWGFNIEEAKLANAVSIMANALGYITAITETSLGELHVLVQGSSLRKLAVANAKIQRKTGKTTLSDEKISSLQALASNATQATDLIIRKKDFDSDTKEYYLDTIKSAELQDEQSPTYDISVPENTTYVANGFVSHNTIGLQMSCNTTGVEPDFALVKFKTLAGGGYLKIVNNAVTDALNTLGYTPEQIHNILEYALGTQTLSGSTAINKENLKAKGLSETTISKVEGMLKSATELPFAFGTFTIGEEELQKLGFKPEEYLDSSFNLLKKLGYTNKEIHASSNTICGHQTVEGSPELKAEHLAVFDTANRCGDGERFLDWRAHVKVLAATAPHLSGAASKTINMVNSATVQDVKDAYELSYKLGVKCNAIYRDGSKMSQVLTSQKAKAEEEEASIESVKEAMKEAEILIHDIKPGISPSDFYNGTKVPQFKMPAIAQGPRFEFTVGGDTKVFLLCGNYEDGSLGEVFISVGAGKSGTLLDGVFTSFAMAISFGLQYGVPLERYVEKFMGQTFAPAGIVQNNPNLKMCTSVIDAIFRILAFHYLGRSDIVQVKEPKPVRMVPAGSMGASTTGLLSEEDSSEYELPRTEDIIYSDQICPNCGNRMRKAGVCFLCDCGHTSGCS